MIRRQIEELRFEREQLRIVAGQLCRDNNILGADNQILTKKNYLK